MSLNREDGWSDNDYRQVNYDNGNWFGLTIGRWSNGNLESLGLRIDNKRFGWVDVYYYWGSVNTFLSGFYLNDKKI